MGRTYSAMRLTSSLEELPSTCWWRDTVLPAPGHHGREHTAGKCPQLFLWAVSPPTSSETPWRLTPACFGSQTGEVQRGLDCFQMGIYIWTCACPPALSVCPLHPLWWLPVLQLGFCIHQRIWRPPFGSPEVVASSLLEPQLEEVLRVSEGRYNHNSVDLHIIWWTLTFHMSITACACCGFGRSKSCCRSPFVSWLVLKSLPGPDSART